MLKRPGSRESPDRLRNLTTNMGDKQGLGLEGRNLAKHKCEDAMGKGATGMRWVVGQKHGATGMLALRRLTQ